MSVLNYYISKRQQIWLDAKNGKLTKEEWAKKVNDLYDECSDMDMEDRENMTFLVEALTDCLKFINDNHGEYWLFEENGLYAKSMKALQKVTSK